MSRCSSLSTATSCPDLQRFVLAGSNNSQFEEFCCSSGNRRAPSRLVECGSPVPMRHRQQRESTGGVATLRKQGAFGIGLNLAPRTSSPLHRARHRTRTQSARVHGGPKQVFGIHALALLMSDRGTFTSQEKKPAEDTSVPLSFSG